MTNTEAATLTEAEIVDALIGAGVSECQISPDYAGAVHAPGVVLTRDALLGRWTFRSCPVEDLDAATEIWGSEDAGTLDPDTLAELAAHSAACQALVEAANA